MLHKPPLPARHVSHRAPSMEHPDPRLEEEGHILRPVWKCGCCSYKLRSEIAPISSIDILCTAEALIWNAFLGRWSGLRPGGHSGGMVKGREPAGGALDLEPGEDRRWQDVVWSSQRMGFRSPGFSVSCGCTRVGSMPQGPNAHLAAMRRALSASWMFSSSRRLSCSSWVRCLLSWRRDWSFLLSSIFASERLCKQTENRVTCQPR